MLGPGLENSLLSNLIKVKNPKFTCYIFTYSHCEKIGLNEEIPLWTWFSKGFAGVLHISALEKIWDKVIGGSIKILVYVALTKVELAQNVLLGCHTANEAIRSLNKVL